MDFHLAPQQYQAIFSDLAVSVAQRYSTLVALHGAKKVMYTRTLTLTLHAFGGWEEIRHR
jgi:hypothetical protein